MEEQQTDRGPAAPGAPAASRRAEPVAVIATTISGSIQDWSKVERIVPLFAAHGLPDVQLHVCDSHAQARARCRELVVGGARTVISAGGSGTFNAVLEGCCDAGVPLGEVRLGFLRKGSADLIGKALGMPDEIGAAVAVFAAAIHEDRTVPCDVLEAEDASGRSPRRHFVGYGGAGVFGRIPHYTENRCLKWYKGVLGQVFGDLGPFTMGMTLATLETALRRPFAGPQRWRLVVDGRTADEGAFLVLLIANGYLGPELAYSSDPLGSGRFHLFALRDLGLHRLGGQVARARRGTIAREAERWGWREHAVAGELRLERLDGGAFPANVDGSTYPCGGALRVRIVDRIRLFAAPGGGAGAPR